MPETPATRPSLLVRLRDPRDGQAWELFVRIYAPLIYGLARRHGLQDADAADLTQEVLRTVARALPDFEYDPARGRFQNWLYAVVRTRLSNFLQARRARPDQGRGDTVALEEIESNAGLAVEWWEQEYRRQLFARAVDRVRPAVEPRTWEAFQRTAVDGLPALHVARDLGMSVAAVYMARCRVLARLRDVVRQLEEEADA
jgi:RNA polymerase sigma-70 factor (ECF subfamily)